MLALEVPGGLPGGLLIRESPTLASLGQHSIRPVASGTRYAGSSFDIFTEVSADGGTTWEPASAAMRLELTEPELMVLSNNALPPAGTVMATTPAISFPGSVQVRNLRLHSSRAAVVSLPLAGSLLQFEEQGRARGELSTDGGATFALFECDYSAKRKYQARSKTSEADFVDAELVALQLTGGSLPAGMRIRESPTKASLGRVSSRRAPDGLHRIGFHQDFFAEISLDDGASWSPQEGPPPVIEIRRGPSAFDLAVFGFTPQEVTSPAQRPAPSPAVPPLGTPFQNGDIPDQEDLVEYPDGTIVRRWGLSMFSDRIIPPAPGSPPVDQALACLVRMEVSSDGGVTFEPLAVPSTATLRVHAAAGGAGASSALHEMEILALDVSATLGSGLSLMLRESPTLPSRGQTVVGPLPDGRFLVGSFFDVFTELSLDGGGTWSAARRNRCYTSMKDPDIMSNTAVFPPPGGVMDCDDGDVIQSPDGVVLRRVMLHKFHHGESLPSSSASASIPFSTGASGELSLDGGRTFSSWWGHCDGVFQLTSVLDDGAARYFDVELLSLNLSGGGLGSVMVRESPTRASLGRCASRAAAGGSFATTTRFSAFMEVSADHGATWTPSSGSPVEFSLQAPPQDYFHPVATLPVRGVEECDDAVELSSSRIIWRMRKRPEILFQAWDTELDERVIPVSGTLEGEISTDGGATRQPFQTTYTETLRVRTNHADGSLDIENEGFACMITSGGTTVSIRESPTLPSTGRVMKRHVYKQVGTKFDLAGFMVRSSTDLFTEVSFDNGLVWSPRSNLLRFDLVPEPGQDNAFGADFLPPRDGVMRAVPGSRSTLYWTNAVVRDMVLEGFSASQPSADWRSSDTMTFGCVCRCDVSLDGGATWQPHVTPATLTLRLAARDTTPDSPFEGEVLALDVSLPGGLMIRESPTRSSSGETRLRWKAPELLSGRACVIESSFDLHAELSADGGTTWTPADEACRLAVARAGLKVACSGLWNTEAIATHRAADPEYKLGFQGTGTTISGLVLGPASSFTPEDSPPAAAGEINHRTCTCHAGYYVSSSGSSTARRVLNVAHVNWVSTGDPASADHRALLTEMEGLHLTGDAQSPGLMLRESPTRVSSGRISLEDAAGGLVASSQVDVFLELSEDGGATWHPATTALRMEAVDAVQGHGIGNHPPLPPNHIARAVGAVPRAVLETRLDHVEIPAGFDTLVSSSGGTTVNQRTCTCPMGYYVSGSSTVTKASALLNMTYSLTPAAVTTLPGTEVHDISISAFSLEGGSLPAGMRLRESPTRASLGRMQRTTRADGSSNVTSFFDVFTEISHDDGATWEPLDIPLHFSQQDRQVSSLSHSDHFTPQGLSYRQRGMSLRCEDVSLSSAVCDFTTPPAPLPGVPGATVRYPGVQGSFAAALTRPDGSTVPVSAGVLADIDLTLTDTADGTRYCDAAIPSLSLTGTVSPPGFRLRESPTRASLGRHIVADAGGGEFRITSFFDIWTEISLDGGLTWSEADAPLRLEIAGPEIEVRSPADTPLVAGSSTLNLGFALTGSTVTRQVVIRNTGSSELGGLAVSLVGPHAGDFSISPPSAASLAPGGEVVLELQLHAGASGARDATLRIESNDSDESKFDVTLTGRVLAPDADDDGDGLTNQQEVFLLNNPMYSEPATAVNPLFDNSAERTLLRDNGLFLASDVHALNLDVPLLERIPGTNQFRLTLGIGKSTDLRTFTPFPLIPGQTSINPVGELEFLFTSPDNAAFFRVQSE